MAKVSRITLAPVLAKLAGQLGEKQLASELASYLLVENRTGELDSLMRDIITFRASNGVVEVTAVSARPLASASENEIKSSVKALYPSAKEIIINQRVDASAVGGVRLEFPDQQLDLSLRQKLNKFKQLTTGS